MKFGTPIIEVYTIEIKTKEYYGGVTLHNKGLSLENVLDNYCKNYNRTIYGFHISDVYLIAKLVTGIDTEGVKIIEEIYISKLKMDF